MKRWPCHFHELSGLFRSSYILTSPRWRFASPTLTTLQRLSDNQISSRACQFSIFPYVLLTDKQTHPNTLCEGFINILEQQATCHTALKSSLVQVQVFKRYGRFENERVACVGDSVCLPFLRARMLSINLQTGKRTSSK